MCVNCELTKAFKVHNLCHWPRHNACLLCNLVLRAGSVFPWGGFSTSCSHWAQGRSGTTLQVKEVTFLRGTQMDISFDHFFQNTTCYIIVPSWKKKKTQRHPFISILFGWISFCTDSSAHLLHPERNAWLVTFSLCVTLGRQLQFCKPQFLQLWNYSTCLAGALVGIKWDKTCEALGPCLTLRKCSVGNGYREDNFPSLSPPQSFWTQG